MIAKLYKKLTDLEFGITDRELDFLVQYEMPHILHLDDMRTVGFPCSSNAVKKMIIDLKRLRGQILEKLNKRDLVVQSMLLYCF